jgi:hypothetical protein
VVTAGKDGMLRALDRETHRVLYETPTTTPENTDTPEITTPLRAWPGRAGRQPLERSRLQPRDEPALCAGRGLVRDLSSFEHVRYIPGKLYMGGRTDLDPVEKSQGWVTASPSNFWVERSPGAPTIVVFALPGDAAGR